MTVKTIREAISEALFQEMDRDKDVVLMGEDIRGYRWIKQRIYGLSK